MSIGGSSPLGTLLIQRLDAALGNTTGQQSNIVTGARPDAVSQSAQAERTQALQNQTARHPRDLIDQTQQQGQQPGKDTVRHGTQLDNRQAAIEALLRHTNSSATQSAPTTLGRAARTILEIIERFPDGSAPLQGRQPIISSPRLQALLQEALLSGQALHSRARSASSSLPGGVVSQSATPPGTTAGAKLQGSAGSPGSVPPAQIASLLPHLKLDQLVQHLAQGLRTTLQQSGMFYESQLAQLAFGKGNLSDLRLQPQNTPSADSALPSSNRSSSADAGELARGSNPASPSSTPAAGLLPGQDGGHLALIRQQLEVLAAQQFVWRGEALPNLPLEWRVEREQEHEGSPNHRQTVNSERWNSKLLMQLPSLGSIEFQVSLNQKQVSLSIRASDAAVTLRPHLQDLDKRLRARGLTIERLSLNATDTNSGTTAPNE